MAAASLREYVIRYINFFPRADCDRDIHFSGEITVDREKARCYTVCDGDYLPDRTVRSDVEDTTLPVSGCSLYMAELEGLGVHLHCNHAVNQILYFEGSEKLYEEFSRRVAVYRTNKDGTGPCWSRRRTSSRTCRRRSWRRGSSSAVPIFPS